MIIFWTFLVQSQLHAKNQKVFINSSGEKPWAMNKWTNRQTDYFIEPSFCGYNICDSSKMEQNKILLLYSMLIKQETSKDKARCSGWQAGFGKFLKKLKRFEIFSRPTRYLHVVNKCIYQQSFKNQVHALECTLDISKVHKKMCT